MFKVRSVETCTRSLKHLQNHWEENKNYDYIRNQFKSLRQDIQVQHLNEELTVRVYEINARICLEVRDFSGI